jgi:drug/metabolite transporter (DMT)-like permease
MRKGISLVLITALISGLANFFNKFAMQALAKDAFQYTFLKNIFVALIFSFLILMPWILPKLKKLSKNDWLKIFCLGLIGGGIPFLLFFKGLSLTSAVSASFIHKTLFIWVAIFAWPFLKEKISIWQFGALGVLLWGNMIFEGFKGLSWGLAETLILGATLFWAFETILIKKFLANIDFMILAWGRMFFGSLIIFAFLATTNNLAGLTALNQTQALWIILVSLLLCGYVLTWYAALNKLPVTVVASILVLASPITTLMNSIFVTHKVMASNQIFGLGLISFSIIFLIYYILLRYNLNNFSEQK